MYAEAEIWGVLVGLVFKNSQNQSMSMNLFLCNFKPVPLAPVVIQSKVVASWKVLFHCWEDCARCSGKRTPWKIRIWRETYPTLCTTAMLCLWFQYFFVTFAYLFSHTLFCSSLSFCLKSWNAFKGLHEHLLHFSPALAAVHKGSAFPSVKEESALNLSIPVSG